MAIKKLTFSFEVPITQLLGLIATGNTGLKIDVAGDERSTKAIKALANGHAPKLLESPEAHARRGTTNRSDNGMPSWHMMMKALAANPDHTKSTMDLGKMLASTGLSEKSVSPQLSKMKKDGFVKAIDKGVYQLTAKGALHAEKLGFPVAHRKLKPKPKKKTLRSQLSKAKRPPPAPAPVETPATETPVAEQGNG